MNKTKVPFCYSKLFTVHLMQFQMEMLFILQKVLEKTSHDVFERDFITFYLFFSITIISDSVTPNVISTFYFIFLHPKFITLLINAVEKNNAYNKIYIYKVLNA